MTQPDSIRVATYNIRSLRDDAHAVVRVIRALDADIVCIQEAPRFLFWRHRCRQFAAASGLHVIGGGRAAAANLLLAKGNVNVHRTRDVRFSKHRRLSQRGAALADVTVSAVRLAILVPTWMALMSLGCSTSTSYATLWASSLFLVAGLLSAST